MSAGKWNDLQNANEIAGEKYLPESRPKTCPKREQAQEILALELANVPPHEYLTSYGYEHAL